MKNKMFFAGILSIALVFGMIVGSCKNSNEDDDITGKVKVRVGHFASSYSNEVITKITIYEYDLNKPDNNNKGTIHQTVSGLNIKYGEYWEDGEITKTGQYIVEVVIGANAYSALGEISIFDFKASTVVLQYNGHKLVKQ